MAERIAHTSDFQSLIAEVESDEEGKEEEIAIKREASEDRKSVV